MNTCDEQISRLEAMSDDQFRHLLTHIGNEVKRRWPAESAIISGDIESAPAWVQRAHSVIDSRGQK